MSGHPRANNLMVAMVIALLASACTATAPAPRSSPVTTAVPTTTPVLGPGGTALTAGTHAARVMGTGTYPSYTVVVPPGWFDLDDHFIITGPTEPVLGLSVWDVGEVFRDPCNWQGQGFVPGPGVANLVAALVAQKMRNATTPTDVTLAGYAGKYLEWSVPADLKSSSWTNFDACDLDSDGVHHDFLSWLGNGTGDRYEEVPGQVDKLWVLDVNGQRLVVDATYSPSTSQADRAELERLVDSLRFSAP
ncbi:MAG: hypothetical protein WB807_03655 [Candidatus Dormiibacterota bacterium]